MHGQVCKQGTQLHAGFAHKKPISINTALQQVWWVEDSLPTGELHVWVHLCVCERILIRQAQAQSCRWFPFFGLHSTPGHTICSPLSTIQALNALFFKLLVEALISVELCWVLFYIFLAINNKWSSGKGWIAEGNLHWGSLTLILQQVSLKELMVSAGADGPVLPVAPDWARCVQIPGPSCSAALLPVGY